MAEEAENPSIPFEGPEKLLEIWFAPDAAHIPSQPTINGQIGLRLVERQVWEQMLDIVRCKVLSVIKGQEMDAYLLSESSFFIFPHKLILKTCGTTLNLLGLPRILEIAATQANLPNVYRCFYSRKSFMFPERQEGPHRDWKGEVEFLDNIFSNGAAYSIGKMNGDHWLLYLTNPDDHQPIADGKAALESPVHRTTHVHDSPQPSHSDYTIEILMSGLSSTARAPFFFPELADSTNPQLPSSLARNLSEQLGISDIFPPDLTTLDSYSFVPCGYSSNAIIKWGEESLNSECHSALKHSGEGYYTIHVTPEEGWSYASFECNVPLSSGHSTSESNADKIPTLKSLIKRVVSIFQPSRLTLTLFISSEENESSEGETALELAQRAFRAALTETPESSFGYVLDRPARRYKRTDKINYEFGGYDLAFASFELK